MNYEKNNIVGFLEKILNDVKSEKVSEKNMKKIQEFYLQFEFVENIDKFSDEEIMKFMSLGYHIYNFLGKENIDFSKN